MVGFCPPYPPVEPPLPIFHRLQIVFPNLSLYGVKLTLNTDNVVGAGVDPETWKNEIIFSHVLALDNLRGISVFVNYCSIFRKISLCILLIVRFFKDRTWQKGLFPKFAKTVPTICCCFGRAVYANFDKQPLLSSTFFKKRTLYVTVLS